MAVAVAGAVVAVRAWSRPFARAESTVLRVAAAWTGGLWLVLIPKILIDGRPAGFTGNLAGFKAVHTVLGLISIASAVWVWRAASAPADRAEESLQPSAPG